MRKRIALLFQDGNHVGREYYHALTDAGIDTDLVIAVGRASRHALAIERERTAGRWNPAPLPEHADVRRFPDLDDAALWQQLRGAGIDIAIQGGIGILKPEMLAVPALGFVNVHPGRLPDYRGCTCPEWALYNGDDVHATAHLIDEGIDTGPVICAARYEIEPEWDYHDFRANLYRHCGKVLLRALRILDGVDPDSLGSLLTPQGIEAGRYWDPIPADKLARAIARLGHRAA